MFIFEKIVLFLLGAAMGSAANALIDRLPREESWLKGRSHCDKCQHELSSWDLIPIFSYIYLRGKCRYCRTTIPYRNLIVEILMGIITILNFKFMMFNQFTIIQYLIIWLTVIIAFMDWEIRQVSEVLVLAWGILSIFNFQYSIINNLTGAIVGVGIIGGIWAITKGKAMGFGDVEMALVMGISLGFSKTLAALWLAFVVGAIVGGVWILLKRAKAKSVIAFGPFLILGYWGAYVWGDKIIKYIFGGYV